MARPSKKTAIEYNLLGQRIGPKGRQVRDRLLASARDLMASDPTSIPTLTAITTEADVKLTTIYRYYPDLGGLLIDAMLPVREEMKPIIELLEEHWPEGREYPLALAFVRAHFVYWSARKGVLFVRNSLAERGDYRFARLRSAWGLPLATALASKFAHAHGRSDIEHDFPMAGIVISGLERTTTLTLHNLMHHDREEPYLSDPQTMARAQKVAVAQLITTLMTHDYLQS